MKIAKKSLSIFLSLLMIFSACSVGLTGIIASAADLPALLDEDGSYTADEVRAYLAKAAAEYDASGLVNANNTLTYEGNYSMLLAADAVISYALKNYNTGFGGRIANNTGETLAGALVSGLGITDGTQQGIVYAILDPAGTKVFSYWGSLPIPNSDKADSSRYAWHSGSWVGGQQSKTEITNNNNVKWDTDSDENLDQCVESLTKTTSISVDAAGLNSYLLTFDSVASVPKKIPTRIQFTFDYGREQYAYCYSNSGFILYTNKYVAYRWNYFTNVKSSIRAKETKVKKQLENFVEYFTQDVLSLTFDEMLEMSAADLYNYYLVAQGKVDAVISANLNDAVLDHFLQTDSGSTYADVKAYIADLYEAYLIVLGKGSIDVLFNDIGTDYSDMSYAEMSELYASVSTAYDVVVDIDKDILDFIITNYEGYADKYNSVTAALADAKTYIDELYAAMRIQHIKELRENMIDMYNEYYEIAADTNNLEDIDTTQLTAVVDKANGINETLKNYTAAEIAQVISADERTAWDDFCAKLDAKLAVRDDEAAYDSFFDYFFPYLFQDYTGMSNEELMDLHANSGTELEKLRTIYGEFVAQYGQEWTDALFTVTYNGETGLLHDLVNKNYAASNSALATYMTAINSAQLATIAAYAGLTTVDFTNYADLRSTLKHFDDAFYTYCLEQGWVSSNDAAVYATIESLLASWKAFVSTSGEAAFNHNFTYADSNGVYADRYAGDQTVEEPDGEGGTNEVQIGYPNDIARDNEDKDGNGIADDNYTVTEDEITETIVKIDNFIVSRDFASIIGLKDLVSGLGDIGLSIDEDELENIVDLPSLVNILFEEAFSDDILNTLVGAIFPMLTDLINTELKGVLRDLGEPETKWGNATGAYAMTGDDMIGSKWAGVEGVINIFLDEDVHDHDDGSGEELYKLQNSFPQVFADLGLYIYPSTMAQFLAQSDPATFGPNTEFYKTLYAAGRDWSQLVAEDDPETKEDESKKLELEWGVYDFDSFKDALGIVLDTILPVLQTALGNTGFEETAQNAAFIYGKPKIYLLQLGTEHGLAAVGDLDLSIAPLELYNKVFVPLFEALGVTKEGYVLPKLQGEFEGADVASAILDPVRVLLDQIVAAPLSTILDMLPNLIYFLSMDSVAEIIEQAKITLDLGVGGVDVKTDLSGAVGDIISLFEGALDGLIEFPLELNLGELLDLDEMLDFNLTDLNDIIQTLVGDDMNLPRLDQTTIMFASDWENTTSANGSPRVNLRANKADVLYAILSYAVSALGTEGFLEGLLGDSVDPAVKELISKVASNVYYNMDGAIAAIMEILVPNTDANGEPEYELDEIDWIKQGAFDYGGIEGADQMSIVYLNYGNDWTKEDSKYIIENVDAIVATILEMTDSDIESLNSYLADMVNGIFTNDVITDLVKMLGGLGDSPSAFINDIISEQIGVDITVWFDAFGYLFPADTWKEDAVVVAPGSADYTTTFANVTATADAEGNITWAYAGESFADGDKTAFINILCELLAEFDVAVGFLFGGWDITAFDSLLELKGYDSYASTLGVLLETLGIKNIPTQADFSADPIGGLKATLTAIAGWFDELVASENMIETVLELIPDLFYYIESNGLATLLHNMLMPILVIVDDVRPLLDVNLNGVLSLIVSQFLNYQELDVNVILQYLGGAYMNDDLDYKEYKIDINKLTLSEILKIADTYLGTDLYNSGLVQIGLKGLCSGVASYDSVVGTGYKTTVDAADTLTILITALVDCLSYPAQDKSKTNGDVVFEFVAEMTGNEDVTDMYAMISEVIKGIELEYSQPNWGYMFPEDAIFSVDLPEHTIVYLGYNTDWDKETADNVYGALDEILTLVLDSTLEEGETLKTLIDGLLEDNVYSDEILNTLVELIVNALAGLDATLFELVDVVVSTNISEWFTFCELDEESGEYVCTYDWGIDEKETVAEKKDAFVNAIKAVLAPANELLAWLFFGGDYKFFTGSETDENGEYVFNDLITLNGGEGYARGLVPILEALGCTMQPAANFYDEATKTYNAGEAVGALLDSVLALADKITANPIEEVFTLLPNLIYFINADGVKSSVNNLLAPVNGIIEKLAPIVGEVSIGGLLAEQIGFDICNITTDALLQLAADNNVVINDEIVKIIKTFYIGKLVEFTSANGLTAYKLAYTEDENAADMVTIVLSLALDLFNDNEVLFSDLLGADVYAAVKNLIANTSSEFTYQTIDWAYMYEGEDLAARLQALVAANGVLPERSSDIYATYTKYQNNWNKETVDKLDGVLEELADIIATAVAKEDTTLGALIEGLLADNVYSDAVLNSLIEMVVELLADYEDIIANAGALLGAEGIADWFDYCEITTDENGDTVVTCTKNWGVDDAAAEDKRDAFINAFVEALAPANRLLAWLLFAEDYTFFNGTTNEVLITLNGGEGYTYAIAPLFEALGVDMPAASEIADTNEAVAVIADAATSLLDLYCDNTVDAVLTLVPNLIYFLNAGGASAVINNLLVPVNGILDALKAFGVDVDLASLIEGLDITNITTTALLDMLVNELGIYMDEELKEFIATFYIGKLESTGSGYRLAYTEDESRGDMITILLSIVLDVFAYEENAEVFSELLGEDIYAAIKNLIADSSDLLTYQTIDWAYMYEGDDFAARLDALKAANGVLPARSSSVYATYTKYQNNWNKATVDYLDSILEEVADEIAASVAGTDSSIGDLIEGLLADNVYSDSILNSLIEMVVELLVDYEDLIGAAGALLGVEGIADWFDYCEITTDENGDTVVTCTKNWGVDDAAAADKRDTFINAFVEALAPANRLLAWLLFGEDYAFFSGTTGDNLITINGGEGYTYAIAPLFEALGVDLPAADEIDGTSEALAVIADAVTGLLELYCDNTVDAVLTLVPNLIYFLNAGGVSAVVNNLLVPVNNLLNDLKGFGVDVDLASLIEGFDITNITTPALLDMLVNELGIVIPADLREFIETFYIGKLEATDSGYRLAYTKEETRGDMITILLSIVLEVFAAKENTEVFSDLLGADIYVAIRKVLDLDGAKDMQDYDWIYTEYADTDKEFNAVESSVRYPAAYNNIWSRDKAEYIADNLIGFVSNILGLIGLEINGVKIKSLDNLLDSLLEGNLYTQSIADTLLDALKGLPDMLDDLEPYGDYVVGILKNSLGVDLGAWENMTVTVVDGDRDSFVAAIEKMLAPIVPLLNVLLCGEDISFFYNIDGEDVITIYGSEGYAYGIIPVFEALGCTMMTPEEFYKLDNEAKIGAIIEALLDRVDVILADPVNEIFGMLPELIYFINSNGLDTAVNNILNSVDTVLECLEPLIGATSLMELLDVELAEFNFDYLINLAAEAIEESTGLGVETLVMDFVAELTTGKVVSYQSANGETYYKMVYAGKNQMADMITILLRLLIDFIATGDNVDAIIALISGNSENEDAANSATTLIKFVLTALNMEPATSGSMAILYYIFLGLNEGVKGLDYLYGHYGESWDALVAFFEDNGESYVKKAADVLKAILKEFAGIDVENGPVHCDCKCHSSNGFVRFFFKLANFFRRIFGMKQYRYCDCGAAHW